MTPWTPEDIEYLIAQRALGTPINAIALHLNRNRGAVAGKSKRLSASTSNPPCLRATRKPPKQLPPRAWTPTPDYNPDSRNLILDDMQLHQCHYPYGDGHPRFFFCAADAPEYPYCDFHRKVAYRTPNYR